MGGTSVIVGVGIDVVDIARFARRIEANPRLGERLFSAEELGLRPESMAARFSAKEALAKALGALGAQVRAAGAVADHPRVGPAQTHRGTERLGERLLGG